MVSRTDICLEPVSCSWIGWFCFLGLFGLSYFAGTYKNLLSLVVVNAAFWTWRYLRPQTKADCLFVSVPSILRRVFDIRFVLPVALAIWLTASRSAAALFMVASFSALLIVTYRAERRSLVV